jgi:hypothetical protein
MTIARVLAAALLLGASAIPEPQQGVSLKGNVRIKGEIPRPKRFRMDVEKHCAAAVKGMEIDGDDIVADPKGNVKWAFVYVKSGLAGKKFDVPKTPVMMQQQTCRYNPHVTGIMVGQDLLIKSGDPVVHIPHVNPKSNKEWGFSQSKLGEERTKQFTAPEVMVRLICDVHQWMEAWIGVLEHPFWAVTDAAGRFEIKGLPPGKYVIETWHEHYQPVTQEIEIGSSAPKLLPFELTERRPRR